MQMGDMLRGGSKQKHQEREKPLLLAVLELRESLAERNQ